MDEQSHEVGNVTGLANPAECGHGDGPVERFGLGAGAEEVCVGRAPRDRVGRDTAVPEFAGCDTGELFDGGLAGRVDGFALGWANGCRPWRW